MPRAARTALITGSNKNIGRSCALAAAAHAAGRRIDVSSLPPGDLSGCAVLFRTGWSRHWGTPRYFDGHPFLAGEVAARLVAARVALVGIDSLNIDDTSAASAGERPAHGILLAAGIPIVEHLTGLDALPASGFAFSAVPAPIRRAATMPVRAFAVLER